MTTSKTTARKPRAKAAPTAGEVTLVLSPDGPFAGFEAVDELLAYATEAHRNFPAEAPAFIDWGLYDAFEAEMRARLNAAHSEVRGGYERAVAAQPSAAAMYARAGIPAPASSVAGRGDAVPAAAPEPRHAASGAISLPLLRRVRDGLAALAEEEGPAAQAGPVAAEASAPLAPLPQRTPGATRNAPALGESSGEPEWRKLPALGRTGKPVSEDGPGLGQPVPWDGAPTTVRLIPSAVVAEVSPEAPAFDELDPATEAHMAAFEAAHDAEEGPGDPVIDTFLGNLTKRYEEAGMVFPGPGQAVRDEAPDFPAEPTHEERQEDEALDKADPLSTVGKWTEPGTKDGEVASDGE